MKSNAATKVKEPIAQPAPATAHNWSPQQELAMKAVKKWLREKQSREQTFYLAGFAGTGKTTLATALAGDVKGKVLFGAFTGKAALVMRSKGCADASTIHSLIYKIDDEVAGVPEFRLNPNSEVGRADLVVIDEVSMVGQDLAKDLLSFGTPVLVLGDPGQLPPVKDAGYFTQREPDFMLTEVHRQARDNPIIRMSMIVREQGRLERGIYGESKVISRVQLEQSEVLKTDQMLVGINRTRHSYNARIREMRDYTGIYPNVGEKLVCLRNNRTKHLLNGGLWTVEKITGTDRHGIGMILSPDDAGMTKAGAEVYVRKEFFQGREAEIEIGDRKLSDEFTFGYALTVHKAQGSQWNDVLVFDESYAFREDRAKWAYTAVTRAAERITVVQ